MTSKHCSKNKIVVFDLDETLGYFSEFGMIWETLTSYISKNDPNKINQELFNDILDIFPEFLRPNILNILDYLKRKKIKSKCNKLLLYTNNQGPTEWARSIIKYFEMKTNYDLFDQIISAYKINGRQVEMCRTTHSKTHGDLMKCAKLSENDEICFLDDIYHPGMENEHIYYINVKPYKYDLNFTEIINRLLNSNKINIIDENEFKEDFSKNLQKYHYSPRNKKINEYNIDTIISKRILHHLKDFFGDLSQKNKTIKTIKTNKPNKLNKTNKLRTNKIIKSKLNKTVRLH
jgi:hypothetical protein